VAAGNFSDKPRSIFKVFLGYTQGVGKGYSRRSEALQRANRGQDVVIGVVESAGHKATAELASKLERVPPRKLEYSTSRLVWQLVRETDITQLIVGRSARRLPAMSVPVGRPEVSSRFCCGRRTHQHAGGALMPDRLHILVVDDEPQITRVLRTSLSAQGYDIRVANSGEMALEIMKDWQPNLIITDLSMPSIDGVELCRTVRAVSNVPIIVLSVRDKEQQKVEALDAGADDYVTKPFGMNELLARVRANLRRVPAENEADPVIEIGDFRIDTAARKVIVRHREVRLTPKEFDLLVYMARHPGKVITHRALLAAVWGGQSTEQVEYLRVFVGQLRKKLEPDAASPRYLVTEPWVGYRLEPGE
jgi:two-component system KDP operon response regulator KdpE